MQNWVYSHSQHFVLGIDIYLFLCKHFKSWLSNYCDLHMVCSGSAVTGIYKQPFLSVHTGSSPSWVPLEHQTGASKSHWTCFSPRAVLQWDHTVGLEPRERKYLTSVQRRQKLHWCEDQWERHGQEFGSRIHEKKEKKEEERKKRKHSCGLWLPV